jgi:ribonucleoside-diphosphate reductase alpha chain
MRQSPFHDSLAVATWDTWFRWREGGQLRDVTIEATWGRIAAALAVASAEDDRIDYRRQLQDALADWRLLLDERVTAGAGTPTAHWPSDDLVAVLNAAVFVRAAGRAHAAFDHVGFGQTAALAVRALEDAAVLAADARRPPERVRLGMIGVADALAGLGLAYDSAAGRSEAARIARTLADGALAGSIALARTRGARVDGDLRWQRRALERGHFPALVEEAARHGLRFRALTAITAQPRLARFANRVADALDPADAAADANGDGATRLDGHAAGARRIGNGAATTTIPAQLRMRAAVQPWIDVPIDYPLAIGRAPDDATLAAWCKLAAELGLGVPRFDATGAARA